MASAADTVAAMIEAERRDNTERLRGVVKHMRDRAEQLTERAQEQAKQNEYGRAAELYGKAEGYSAAMRQLIHTFPGLLLESEVCPNCKGRGGWIDPEEDVGIRCTACGGTGKPTKDKSDG